MFVRGPQEFLRWWCGAETEATKGFSTDNKNRSEVGDRIYVYRHQLTRNKDHATAFEFFLEVAKPKVVDFELDWSSSKNLEADLGEGDFKVHANPFQRIKLGRQRALEKPGYWAGADGEWCPVKFVVRQDCIPDTLKPAAHLQS